MASTDVEMPGEPAAMGPMSQAMKDTLKKFAPPGYPIPARGGGGVPALPALTLAMSPRTRSGADFSEATDPTRRGTPPRGQRVGGITTPQAWHMGTGGEDQRWRSPYTGLPMPPAGARGYGPEPGQQGQFGYLPPGPQSMNDAMNEIDAALTPKEQNDLLRYLQLQQYA
jgi:hypothetical protein